MLRSQSRLALLAALVLVLAGAGMLSVSQAHAQQTPTLGVVIVQGACGPEATTPVSEVALTGPIDQPWQGEDAQYRGAAPTHVPLAYTDSTYQQANVGFNDVLDNGLYSVMVLTDSADFGSVVACGEIGGIVRNDQVAVALYPVGGGSISGLALLSDDGGKLAVRAYIMTSMEQTAGAPAPVASATPVTGATGATGATAQTIEMVDIAYKPTELTIPANTDVTITLTNNGVAVHNFNIDELNIHSGDVASGVSATVTINAQPGEYEFFCNVPGHREAGMVGKLIVQ